MVPRHTDDRAGNEGHTSDTEHKESPTTRDGASKGAFSRRSCLKLAGAIGSLGAVPFASKLSAAQTSSDSSSDQSYRTITLSEGESRTVVLEDGGTFENVLVDQRAQGAHLRINTSGNVDGFTVRNVGFLGVPQGEKHVMNIAGNGVVENVFVDGRRRSDSDGTTMGGIRLKSGHSGEITVRHTFIAGMGNNASYGSSAGKNGGGNGTIIYENCYHRDNTSSNYRPGTKGSQILNCVSIVNDPEGLRGPYPHSGARGSRGAWIMSWPDQRIENCSFYMSPDDANPNETVEARHFEKSDGPGVAVTIANTGINADAPTRFNERSEADGYARIEEQQVHNSPSVDVLQDGGVPLNPEMAASGARGMPPAIDQQVPVGGIDSAEGTTDTSTDTSNTSDDSQTSDQQRTLTVDGSSASRTNYSFTVDGSLSENPNTGSLGTGDSIDGLTGAGFVNGGVDGYVFTGKITDMSVDGDAAILVDGEEVDPAEIGTSAGDDSSSGDSSSGLPNAIVIDGTDRGYSDYSFTVDGEVGKDSSLAAAESGDSIGSDGSIEGAVNNGVDAFAYSGDITSFSINGNAAVAFESNEN